MAMDQDLRPDQIEILVGSPAVNDEFSRKIKELDRRLQANGMSYKDWETLNDRQHDVFSSDMFLEGDSANSVKHYVMAAVDSCWCPDIIEDLHHHSPILMREIEKQQSMLPDVKVSIGESLNNLNETIDLLLENIILSEQKISCGKPDGGVKFERAVIYYARLQGKGNLTDRDAVCGKGHAEEGISSAENEKKRKGKPYVSHGDQALKAIELLRSVGVTDDDLKVARSAGKAMFNLPQELGEPKTDIIIGKGKTEKLISLKMAGDIQLASKEFKGGTESLNKVLLQYAEEKEKQFKLITEKAKRSAAESSLAELKEELSNIAKQLVDSAYEDGSATRYIDPSPKKKRGTPTPDYEAAYAEAARSVRSKLKNTKNFKAMSKEEQDAEVRRQAKARVDALYKNIKLPGAKAGGSKLYRPREATAALFGALKDEYNWVLWVDTYKQKFVKMLRDFLAKDEEFYFMYVDEELTGRRTFKNYPGAAADWLLSPNQIKNLAKENNPDYEDNVKFYMQVDTDVRAKARSTPLKSPTIRLSINPDKIARDALKVIESGAKVSAANRRDDITEAADTDTITADEFEEVMSSEKVEQGLTKLLSDAISVDDVIASLRQESEDS